MIQKIFTALSCFTIFFSPLFGDDVSKRAEPVKTTIAEKPSATATPKAVNSEIKTLPAAKPAETVKDAVEKTNAPATPPAVTSEIKSLPPTPLAKTETTPKLTPVECNWSCSFRACENIRILKYCVKNCETSDIKHCQSIAKSAFPEDFLKTILQ